jgi:hypothetical protein
MAKDITGGVRITTRRGQPWISVPKLDKLPEPKNLAGVKAEIARRWGTIDLLDILKNADFLTDFTDEFVSVATREVLPRETLRRRLLLCLFALGTNMGIRQMVATGEHEEDEGALRRVRASHITRENLRRAIVKVVNETFAVRDARWWGRATTTASDSKRFGSWDSNLMTEFHARYGSNGIMIYWHVEKGRVCVYSQLKSCSSSEVAAMIEGLLRHCTDAKIEANYTDTHGVVVTWTPCPSLRVRRGRPGRRVRRFRGCLCGYGSSTARMVLSGSICWMRVGSRSRLSRGSCGSWRLGTARPTRSSLTPTICVICGGSSTVMV